jgi:hypothetical protein
MSTDLAAPKYNAATAAALAIAEAIQTLGSAPSGHVYAACMGVLTLSQYEQIIRALEKMGLIRASGNVLYWTGPANWPNRPDSTSETR